MLPVGRACPWQHIEGVALRYRGCTTVNGRPVKNWEDVLGCLHETPCDIVDSRVQMLILRDPRSVAVSTYYHIKTHPTHNIHIKVGETVEKFALRMLPTICRHVYIRYAILSEQMSDKTVKFWFNDTIANPLAWHQRWLSSVGLELPENIVHEATDTALRRVFGFEAKGIYLHPGEERAEPGRLYEEEIGPRFRAKLDDICRIWLPPVLLKKWGIPPNA